MASPLPIDPSDCWPVNLARHPLLLGEQSELSSIEEHGSRCSASYSKWWAGKVPREKALPMLKNPIINKQTNKRQSTWKCIPCKPGTWLQFPAATPKGQACKDSPCNPRTPEARIERPWGLLLSNLAHLESSRLVSVPVSKIKMNKTPKGRHLRLISDRYMNAHTCPFTK